MSRILYWKPIETAPREPRKRGHTRGPLIGLLIPYEPKLFRYEDCQDVGYWCTFDKCFRFSGDDGPHDMQPTHWCELLMPEQEPA